MCIIIKNKTFDRGDMFEKEKNSIFKEHPLYQPITFADTQFDECTFCDVDFFKSILIKSRLRTQNSSDVILGFAQIQSHLKQIR